MSEAEISIETASFHRASLYSFSFFLSLSASLSKLKQHAERNQQEEEKKRSAKGPPQPRLVLDTNGTPLDRRQLPPRPFRNHI